MIYIYALFDPCDKSPMWIGQCVNIRKRLIRHLSIGKHEAHLKKSQWIVNLKSNGLKPEIEILDVVDEFNSDFWEQYYISLFRWFGFDLLNIQLGGQKNRIRAKEEKDKIARTLTGRKATDDTKVKRAKTFYNKVPVLWVNKDVVEDLYITRNIKRSHVARILGINERTLKRKISEFGLVKRNNWSSVKLTEKELQFEIENISHKNTTGAVVGKKVKSEIYKNCTKQP